MAGRFGVTNPKAQHLRFHVQTGGVTLTAQQPENNVVRVTVQALAAILGGCQSLHTNSMDEALALPTETAARLALRTQQIIAHETGVADMVDPLGGSFAVETATDDLEAEAMRLLNGIEARGGALKAIERGEIQREIEESAYRFQRSLEVKDTVVVGLNQFVDDQEAPRIDILRVDPGLERDQVQRLRALRARRDAAAWEQALQALENGARTETNVMPLIIDAVLAWASVGEIATCLRRVFGEHRDAPV
jgi:methylmalonyl-CoA mutase N-terminal domain/subunit